MIRIDIKMPNVCGECPFSDASGDYPYCWVLHANRGYSFDVDKRKFPNCPLKEDDQKEEDDAYKLKDMCRILFNRCRAVGSGGGAMCVFCGMRDECEEMHSI